MGWWLLNLWDWDDFRYFNYFSRSKPKLFPFRDFIGCDSIIFYDYQVNISNAIVKDKYTVEEYVDNYDIKQAPAHYVLIIQVHPISEHEKMQTGYVYTGFIEQFKVIS